MTASPPAAKGWGDEFRALLSLAWPLILAQVAQNALMTTDVVMTGWLGAKYVAAIGLANALFMPLLVCGFGVVSAVTPLAAQARGARDPRSVRRSVRQGFWVAALLAALIIPILWQAEYLYRALGQDAELSALAAGYLRAAAWSTLAALGFNVVRSLLSVHQATRSILVITLSGVFANAALNYALIFGNWGFPRLALVGSGLATSIANALMLLVGLAYVLRHRRLRRYHVLHNLHKPDWPRFWRLLQIGIPIGAMLFAEVGVFSATYAFQGWIGATATAAHNIALTIGSLTFMVPLGLSIATTVRVGIAYGAGDAAGVARAGWLSLGLALGFMALIAAAFLTMPGPIVGLFLDPRRPENLAALHLAAGFLTIAGLFQLVDGAQVVMAAALRGLSDTKIPFLTALAGYWVIGFPACYLLAFPLGLGGGGVWLGLALSLAVVAVALTWRWARRGAFVTPANPNPPSAP